MIGFAGDPAVVVWGDVHVDGKVNIDDVFYLLSAWGACGGCCLGDLNVDGVVDIDDIFAMLAHWGPCP